MTVRRDLQVDLAVAGCAVLVYLGALWNGFALDDRPIIALNPLVQASSGVWQAFLHPYWPPAFGGQLYRPLAVATYALDARLDGSAWFHLVNLLWHAGASVAVAALVRRGAGERSALIAGLLFAVHPVHVEAVAKVAGRAGPLAIRLTGIAAFAYVARLLVFPLNLRADYSPAERTLVDSVLDGRLLLGLACLAVWAALVVLAWRRGRRVEAFAVGWIAIALLPVANLVMPVGVVVAERALYLPSAGFVFALATWLERVARRRVALVLTVLGVAGAARTALRVPVWRNDTTVTFSILEDSPRSYRGLQYAALIVQGARQPERALEYYQRAFSIYPQDSRLLIGAADAAFALGRPALADSLLRQAEQLCRELCVTSLRNQANAARARGDAAAADSLLARAVRLESP